MSTEYTRDSFTISTDKSRLKVDTIHGFLSTSYWATNIPRRLVERSIENSMCFGVYEGENQVGFARVVTDHATFAYLADVFILKSHQGHGLGKWLIACIMEHPDLQGLRRWMLATRDAHGLYSQYGFKAIDDPSRIMVITRPNIYQNE